MTTTAPPRAQKALHILYNALGVLLVIATGVLIFRIFTGATTHLGSIFLLSSYALVMFQNAWSRRSETMAITAASAHWEADERRRILSAKAKAIGGASALTTGLALYLLVEFVPLAAQTFEALGAVQSVEAVVGAMTLGYFVGRLRAAGIFNRTE